MLMRNIGSKCQIVMPKRESEVLELKPCVESFFELQSMTTVSKNDKVRGSYMGYFGTIYATLKEIKCVLFALIVLVSKKCF